MGSAGGRKPPFLGVGWVAQIKLKLFSCNWSLRGVQTVGGLLFGLEMTLFLGP